VGVVHPPARIGRLSMAKPPICPLCGQPVKAKDRHGTYILKRGKIVGYEVRHTTPCPKP
jgi:hypothetical protein